MALSLAAFLHQKQNSNNPSEPPHSPHSLPIAPGAASQLQPCTEAPSAPPRLSAPPGTVLAPPSPLRPAHPRPEAPGGARARPLPHPEEPPELQS